MTQSPTYKPTNVEWLPSIPINWEIGKAKYYFSYTTGFTPPTGQVEYYDEDIVWVTIADLNQKIVIDSATKLSQFAIDKFKPEISLKGSLLFSFKLSVGKVAFAGIDLYTNEAILSILPSNKYDVRYFYYTLPHQLLQNASENIYGAKMLNQELIRNAVITFPSLLEQTTIADYLDKKTADIDGLISKKQQLIGLLREERTAVINHAVTKGIIPNAPLKSNSIEWLGDVPQHWCYKRLKYLAEIQTGGKNTEDRIIDGDYPFFVRSQEVERINTYSFDGEAVLTAGDGVGVAKVFHYFKGKFDYHQRVYRISHFKEIMGKYFFYYLQVNLIKEILKYNAKSTVDSLRLPMFQNFVIAYPNINEQEQIVEYIEIQTQKIDATIENIEKEITLLQEYRTALISEVVTGKIKVV